MGWEEFNRTPYNELVDRLHRGTSCADCHDPDTMALRITRPALLNAMEAQGIDITQATRQEMRTYVCAQCHVEYYFAGEDKVLTFPWTEGNTIAQGKTIDEIEAYYKKIGFTDWTHAETGGGMIKMQHPETELFSTSLHYRSGVACADCHMPYMREGSVKVSDHWLRSPLVNISASCQTCHKFSEGDLLDRVAVIQKTTAELLRKTEDANLAAIDAIVAAKEAGATDEQLAEAMELHRWSQMRWDFISSENSTGFHSPQEAARVLADAIDLARRSCPRSRSWPKRRPPLRWGWPRSNASRRIVVAANRVAVHGSPVLFRFRPSIHRPGQRDKKSVAAASLPPNGQLVR